MTTYRDIDVTPLLYHNPLTPAPYHTIQQNGTIMYTAPNESSHDKIQKSCHAAFGCPNEYELQNLLRGCSSVNIFDDEIIVTTSAVPLPLNGTFALRIGLTRGAKVVGEALHVQLQSGAVGEQQQTSRFIPVKVEAFVLENQREIQVNVIDQFAKVIVLILDVKSGALSSNQAHVVSLPTFECHNGARLSASGCVWLSSRQVLIAMSPKLLCCDIYTGQSIDWDINGGSSSWSLRRMSTMLTPGKSRVSQPSSPAAAICKTNTSKSDILLFTLHSDGSVVKWIYDFKNGLNHSGSRVLEESAWSMDDWSPTGDAVKMCCRTYMENRGFVIGICIKSKLVDSRNRGNVFLSALVHGSIDNDDTSDSFVELDQPSDRSDLDTIVGMSFVDAPRIGLQFLFSTVEGSSLFISFEPSQIGIISKDPIVSEMPRPLSSTSYGFNNDVEISRFLSGEEASDILVIEKVMMRRIFHPALGFCPSRPHVTRALSRILPAQLNRLVVDSERMSIEATVLTALRSWFSLSKDSINKRKTKHNSQSLSNSNDIYDEFTLNAETSLVDNDNKLFEYYCKWQELRQFICDEERWMQWPLSLNFVGSDAYVLQSALLYQVTSNTVTSDLDQSSMELLNILIQTNSDDADIFARFESRIEMLISTSAILFDDEKISIFDDIKCLSESVNCNTVYRPQHVQDAIQNHKRLLLPASFDNLHDFFMSPIVESEVTGNDISLLSESSLFKLHHSQLLAFIFGLQTKLSHAFRKCLSRFILLSLMTRPLDFSAHLLLNLAQLKAIHWVISNMPQSDVSTAFRARCSLNAFNLLGLMKNSISMFLSSSVGGEIAEVLPPSFALRLLAPIVALTSITPSENKYASHLLSIKERIAIYLLQESKSLPEIAASRQTRCAFNLYFGSDKCIDKLLSVDKHEIDLSLSFLIERGEYITEHCRINTEELSEALKEFLPHQSSSFCTELANLPTLRQILFPLLVDGSYGVCLHNVSKDLREQGIGDVGISCTHIVGEFLRTYFSAKMINQMPETATLYSAAVEFAISSSNWEAGFDACKQQPLMTRKISGFTRLVEAMVSQGHTRQLLLLQILGSEDIDWFQVAISTLEEKCRCSSKNERIDWNGSLYSLLVHYNQWKHAANAMYTCYLQSKGSRRGNLSCFAAENLMHNIEQKSRRFLKVTENNQPEAIDLDESQGLVSSETLLKHCLSSSVLSYLSKCHSIRDVPISNLARVLASHGYILESFVLTNRVVTDNIRLYHIEVRKTLCDVIAPLCYCNGSRIYASPTNHQLQFMRMRSGRFLDRRSIGMCLLEIFTSAYADKSNKIAIGVAETLLAFKPEVHLPKWLTMLLTGVDSSIRGLFASHSLRNSKADPASLLRLFMKYGCYIEACDLVSNILADPRRRTFVTKRIPEKGDVDFVPYHDIDLLWVVSEKAVNLCDDPSSLSKARLRMVAALENHFQLAKYSQEAIMSARAVAH